MKRFVFAFICLFFSLNTALATVPATERAALVALYNSTGGSQWDDHSNWLSGDPCTNDWYGITCELRTNVNGIELEDNNLVGTIPNTLGNLSKLTELWLSDNELSGPIPATLGNLTNLHELWLDGNQLTGSIPIQLGNLSKLVSLALQYNQLSGPIPVAIGNLSNLDYLTLQRNQLTGTIPSALGNLSNLNYLKLNNNQLSGTIPTALGNLSKLWELELNDNMLSGLIPATFGNLVNLSLLDLNDNSLSGQIPTTIVKLVKLITLSLYGNQLSGPIPADLGKLTKLLFLYLNKNQLSGTIPASLSKMTDLATLRLNRNQLTGSIPSFLGNLTGLSDLQLGRNQLSGTIPATLGNLTGLYGLELNDNQLSGVIPTTLGKLTRMYYLDLQNNQLSGSIPTTFGTLTAVRELLLFNNQLSGTIPAAIGDLANLDNLKLHDNMLSGVIPARLSNLAEIRVLWLHGNQLSGSIPTGFMDFSKLAHLNLNWNALYTNNTDLDDFLDAKSKSNWSSTQTIPPKMLRVVGSDSGAVSLAWNPIEYTADGGGYRIWYGTNSGGPFMNGGFKANKNSNSHTVSGLTSGQKYYFVVKAQTNSHSNNTNVVVSGNSAQVSRQTDGVSSTPGQPSGVSATDGTWSDKVRISFNTVSGATKYRVYRCLTSGQTCGSPIGYPVTGTFDDRKGVSGTVYYYRVRACHPTACGSLSAANTGFSSTAPAKPTGIKATDGTYSDKVRVTFNTVAGATVYRVFRCLTTGPTCGSPIGYPKMGVFDDTKGDPGTVYYYRVRACTATTCGLFSVANSGYQKTVPAKPTGIKASDGTYPLRVRVTWNKVADATVYRVFRCLTTGTTCGSPIAFQKVPVLDDFKCKSGVVYYYRVRACTATTCGLFSVANSGYRGSVPTSEADNNRAIVNDVPIPALSNAGRWLLILMALGLGWLARQRSTM